MKRMHTLWALALLMVGTTFLTGCEVDNGYDADDFYYDRYGWWNDSYRNPSSELLAMAQTLRGHWEGRLEARGRDADGNYGQKSYFTDIEFDQYNSNAIYGRGVQADYLSSTDRNPFTRRFSWHIDSWTKAIHLDYDNGYSMTIAWTDLDLTDNSFSGTMRGENETDRFSFRRYTLAKKGWIDLEEETDSLPTK